MGLEIESNKYEYFSELPMYSVNNFKINVKKFQLLFEGICYKKT